MASDVELVKSLTPLVGSLVKHASLVIWPDEHLGEASTELQLVSDSGGSSDELCLCIGADGQTPVVERRHLQATYRLSDLEARHRAWCRPGFSYGGCEVFAVEGDPGFDGVVGSWIRDIGVIHFHDDSDAITGVELALSSGLTVYVVPGVSGTRVTTSIRRCEFPSPVSTRYLASE